MRSAPAALTDQPCASLSCTDFEPGVAPSAVARALVAMAPSCCSMAGLRPSEGQPAAASSDSLVKAVGVPLSRTVDGVSEAKDTGVSDAQSKPAIASCVAVAA